MDTNTTNEALSPASESEEPTAATSATTITHDAELSPAASNGDGTHAVIPNAHASFLTRLAAAVTRGEQDVAELVRAIERVFGHVG